MPQVVELSFRRDDVGGEIDRGKAWQCLQELRGRPHLIFFIHGYNDPLKDAQAAYDAFYARQQNIVGGGRDWAPGACVVRLFWPGDARWGFLAKAYYPWAVPRAQEVAALFANMLVELGAFASGIVTVDFVAHSLGNRLLLRALALVPQNAKIWVRRVVHMAAAVPRWKLDDPTDNDALARGLAQEANAKINSRATSLYSGNDRALGIVFQIGETLTALHDGLFPIALGSKYWFPSKVNPSFAQKPAIGADHGDYWGADDARASQAQKGVRMAVAHQVHSELALASTAPRQLPSSTIFACPGEPTRALSGRVTAKREPGCSL